MNKADTIRALFEAYHSKNRDIAEKLLAENFTFTSPYDGTIDRATYFERCWPTSDYIQRQDIDKICVTADEAFVRYFATTRDGKQFSNTEFFTFTGNQISSVTVYFGASYRDGVFLPQALS